MQILHLKKGHDINAAGTPPPTIATAPPPRQVAMLPSRLLHVSPRLLVRKEDRVRQGSPLFSDKKMPEIQYLSPGCGRVADIVFGPRRAVERIVIELSDTEDAETFPVIPENLLPTIERDRLIHSLLESGVWPFVRALPFRGVAPPGGPMPELLIVSAGDGDPFQPLAPAWLKGNESLFAHGLAILRKLAKRVIVGIAEADAEFFQPLIPEGEDVRLVPWRGPYPIHDPGVLLYHLKSAAAENRSWYVNGQDVLLIAEALREGRYPISRMVAVGGTTAGKTGHVRTRMGAPLALLAPEADPKARRVTGGLLTGFASGPDGFLGLYETSLTVLPEGDHREFLGFARPGWHRPSFSRTFLSTFRRTPFEMDCNTHGEERSCVNCGYCAQVCPVDILPQYTMKALAADEIEEALTLGLLDCVECGLCSYVCPSKVELTRIMKTARAAYFKEMSA